MDDSYLQKVREAILKESCSVNHIPLYVKSYNEIVEEWKKYKKEGKLTYNHFLIYNAFEFHKTHDNHVLLFHGVDFTTCLLFCKYNGIYKFVSIPCKDSRLIPYNFIATYV